MQDLSSCNSSFCDFERSYRQGQLPSVKKLMTSVLGCDYGGTSWTTRNQAERIIDQLELGDGNHLLDVGSGAGWPGLFLAGLTRCEVTMLDLPLLALQQARQRARDEKLDARCRAVNGSGTALPFSASSFDRLAHSDVLCCLSQKEQLLSECRRVARSGARMLFTVISVAPGVSGADRRRATEAGPPFVDKSADYAVLLNDAGWQVAERIDVTNEYVASLGTLVENMVADATTLVAELGRDEHSGQVAHRREQIDVIERGWLIRELFVSTAAGRHSTS